MLSHPPHLSPGGPPLGTLPWRRMLQHLVAPHVLRPEVFFFDVEPGFDPFFLLAFGVHGSGGPSGALPGRLTRLYLHPGRAMSHVRASCACLVAPTGVIAAAIACIKCYRCLRLLGVLPAFSTSATAACTASRDTASAAAGGARRPPRRPRAFPPTHPGPRGVSQPPLAWGEGEKGEKGSEP